MQRVHGIAIAIFASLLSACSAPTPSAREATTTNAIVGGRADVGHPAVAYILFDTDVDKGFDCTGTLVAPTVIVTAAHCVHPHPPATQTLNYRVYFGNDPGHASASEFVPALSVVAHPAYDNNPGAGGGKDVAVVLLAAPIAGIEPVALNRDAIDGATLGSVVAVGFGNDDGVNVTGDGLKRTARLSVRSVGPEELSAGRPGRTTCQGDSGGPWLAQLGGGEAIIGLTSYGPQGCTDASTATRVDRVIDFLAPFLEGTDLPAPPQVPSPPPAPAPAPPPPPPPAPPAGGGTVAPGGPIQGTVSGTQVATYSVSATNLALTFQSDDAILEVDGGGNHSTTEGSGQVNVSSDGPTTYTIRISSGNGAAQSYQLLVR